MIFVGVFGEAGRGFRDRMWNGSSVENMNCNDPTRHVGVFTVVDHLTSVNTSILMVSVVDAQYCVVDCIYSGYYLMTN